MIESAIKEYKEVNERLGHASADLIDDTKARKSKINACSEKLERIKKNVAIWMHNNYEEIAKGENWNTQESCKVEFDKLPEENRKVMLELSKRILSS